MTPSTALKLRIALLEGIIENLVDGVVMVNAQGRFLLFNPAARRILGVGKTETTPDQWTARYGLFLPDRVTPFPTDRLPLVRALRGETVREEEIFVRHADAPGGVWLSVNATPLTDETGPLPGAIAIFRDTSERKRMDEELLQAKDAAEAASRAKSAFLAAMSHEFRTPLNAILGFTDLLADSDLPPEQQEHASVIRNSGKLLLSLIEDVLDFSRIEAGHLALEYSPFVLRDLVAETMRMLSHSARNKGLELAFYVAPGVPIRVVGDPRRLRQVLLNLVGNAVKFTESGEVVVDIERLPSTATALPVRFQIRDTGIGIPRDKQAVIFESFVQADGSTRRRFGGSGLGLSISAKLVEAMGGRLEVESEPGRGSTFSFTAMLTPVEEDAQLPMTPAATGPLRTRRPMRILLAEDSPANRLLAGRLLERWGHAVVFAGDGAEAVDSHAREHPDLILMDLEMPGMDGLEAARRIRSAEAPGVRVPIVAMTAHTRPVEQERCLAAGMDGFVPKPLDLEHLFRVLEAFAIALTRN